MSADILTPERAAELLGVSARSVRRWCESGDLPARKVGKRQWRIKVSVLAERHPDLYEELLEAANAEEER